MKGCRRNVVKMANAFAEEGFTVVAIDHPQSASEAHLHAMGIKDLDCQDTSPVTTVFQSTLWWFNHLP